MSNPAFNALIEHFLNEYWRLHPVEATQSGIHTHDARLTDWSEAGLAARDAWRVQHTRALNAFADADLSDAQRIDKRVALGELAQQQIHAEWQYFRRAPALYLEEALSGVHFLLARPDVATPQAERDAALIARLQGIPQLLAAGRANIDPALVAPEFKEIVATNADGALRFIGGLQLPKQAKDAHAAAMVALADFRDFINTLQPRGGFAIGRALYDRLLREQHGLTVTADDVHATGEKLSAELQLQMATLAHSIDPSRSWQQIVEAQKTSHPTRETLLQTYHDEMLRARDFVRAKGLVDLPPGDACEIRPTAEFLRATMPLGHFDKTPPFDKNDNLGILYITPIDPALPPERQEVLLQAHCFTAVRSICFHETYPGHHLQFWWSKLNANALRRQFPSTLYLEGWALYCEQMMEENGFFETPELRLWQLKNTAWRSVRMMIDSGLHTGRLTLAQAAQLLVDRAGLEPNTARGEVLRYTTSPTQPSSYMLGKLRMLELRAAYQRSAGPRFTLREFHSWLLGYSSVSPGLIPDPL